MDLYSEKYGVNLHVGKSGAYFVVGRFWLSFYPFDWEGFNVHGEPCCWFSITAGPFSVSLSR